MPAAKFNGLPPEERQNVRHWMKENLGLDPKQRFAAFKARWDWDDKDIDETFRFLAEAEEKYQKSPEEVRTAFQEIHRVWFCHSSEFDTVDKKIARLRDRVDDLFAYARRGVPDDAPPTDQEFMLLSALQEDLCLSVSSALNHASHVLRLLRAEPPDSKRAIGAAKKFAVYFLGDPSNPPEDGSHPSTTLGVHSSWAGVSDVKHLIHDVKERELLYHLAASLLNLRSSKKWRTMSYHLFLIYLLGTPPKERFKIPSNAALLTTDPHKKVAAAAQDGQQEDQSQNQAEPPPGIIPLLGSAICLPTVWTYDDAHRACLQTFPERDENKIFQLFCAMVVGNIEKVMGPEYPPEEVNSWLDAYKAMDAPYDILLFKTRVFALARYISPPPANGGSVTKTLAEIAAHLRLPNVAEVHSVLAQAVQFGVLNCSIDQVRETVCFLSAVPPIFTTGHWQLCSQRLNLWKQALGDLQSKFASGICGIGDLDA